MMFPSLRVLGPALLPLALAACMSPGPAVADSYASASVPIGVDLGGAPARATGAEEPKVAAAMPGMAHEMKGTAGSMRMTQAGRARGQGTGTINAVDIAGRKINLSHGPISALGWPAMTMDFAVAPAVDLRALKPGSRVNFTIEQGAGDAYVIQSVAPADGGR